MKTTWEIVKKETGNKNCSHKVQALEMNSVKITDQNAIANSFNKYFLLERQCSARIPPTEEKARPTKRCVVC
jgi:hypothetical protein